MSCRLQKTEQHFLPSQNYPATVNWGTQMHNSNVMFSAFSCGGGEVGVAVGMFEVCNESKVWPGGGQMNEMAPESLAVFGLPPLIQRDHLIN